MHQQTGESTRLFPVEVRMTRLELQDKCPTSKPFYKKAISTEKKHKLNKGAGGQSA